jgi:hypothetical protein
MRLDQLASRSTTSVGTFSKLKSTAKPSAVVCNSGAATSMNMIRRSRTVWRTSLRITVISSTVQRRFAVMPASS